MGDLNGVQAALNNLAVIATVSGNHRRAAEMFEGALVDRRQSGNDRGSSICLF